MKSKNGQKKGKKEKVYRRDIYARYDEEDVAGAKAG